MDGKTHDQLLHSALAVGRAKERYYTRTDEHALMVRDLTKRGLITREEAVGELGRLAKSSSNKRMRDMIRRAANGLPPEGTGVMQW